MNARDPRATLQALGEAVGRLRARVSGGRSAARPGGPELDVDALMRRGAPTPGERTLPGIAPAPPARLEPVVLPRSWRAAAPLAVRESYDLGELLAYHDVEFVENAYRALLRRQPDDVGLVHHVGQLHRGELSKVDLLTAFRASEEGKRAGVKVRGLRAASALRSVRRIPLLGALAEMLFYATRMPTIVRNLERQEVELFRRERELRGVVDGLAGQVEFAINAASTELLRQQRDKAAQSAVERLARQLAGLSGEIWRLRAESDASPTGEDIARLGEAAQAAASMLDESLASSAERLAAVERAKADAAEVRAAIERLDTVKANEQAVATLFADMFTRERVEALLREGGGNLEDYYVAFEERFRGAREDIKRLMAVHLPPVQAAGAGDSLAPVLDVGCGRGEWLEVLREAGLTARGVDLNGAMARQCRERGLDVVEGDAIAYLREQPEGSLGAVTAMHVIEHLPFELLVELFDEAHRVLRPGGVVIFETPNPENLQVGACNFWYDATHQRPIPPLAAQFLAQERGFARAEIVRLHPYPLEDHPQSGDPELREHFVRLLYGPQDYAVVAWKG